MRRVVQWLLVLCLLVSFATAQKAVVTRNVYLRSDPSTDNPPITKFLPGTELQLIESDAGESYLHVRDANGRTGYVWRRNVSVQEQSENGTATPHSSPASPTTSPVPLLAKGHPVDWWFVFKFNSATFPGCGGSATRQCIFGGSVQPYAHFSQQFAYASSESHSLQQGATCVGDTTEDPVGATFDEVYNGSAFFAIWNDQPYQNPQIQGCGDSCSAPWGHSKGMVAWNENGEGFVLQVTTPSWPEAGNKQNPRNSDGNTLGCVDDNNVQVSQHFFALRLSKPDLLKVLAALANASVVTDPSNPQIVRNGGPADVQALVAALGKKSSSVSYTNDVLSTGVRVISKPSKLHVPPWQMVSAVLGGIPLRTATWWANPKIYSTTSSTTIDCWDDSLGSPGAVEIATTGQWSGKEIGLKGGPGTNFNHAKIAVSSTTQAHLAIFGDMNQQGATSGQNCGSSQNGRGGLFYVIDDATLADSVGALISGETAPTKAPSN